MNCLTILSLRPIIVFDVDLRIRRADAVIGEAVRQVVELLRRIEQRLRRNAADVEAGAAERGLAVLADERIDARGLQAQLRGADRGDDSRRGRRR